MPFVLGTAGHIDHGKSVLVKALTGIDPDRLREEKERGMTIDLGFAWLTLPSGRDVSIVDVPGHERFIKNMLAGVGGIDLALLIVAADESVMPQTREHLAILDLLRVDNGIAVITKSDLVDSDLLELVTMEVEEVLAGTTLAGAPIIPVSATTGESIQELVATIDSMLDSTPSKRDIGRPRLPIDRIFTMSGFGTVVTGTLIDGSLSKGREVVIVPSNIKTHLRGLQSHKQGVDSIEPGSRVAANLANISTEQLNRGDVITTPGWLKPTRALDVKLRLLPSAPRKLEHNTTVTFHTGAAEAQARVRLLDAGELEPGDEAFAQLVLDNPIAVVKDDLFIIRSPMETLGGGLVLDPEAKRHRRFHAVTIERLTAREAGTTEDVILSALDPVKPIELSKLISMCSIPAAEVAKGVGSLEQKGRLVALDEKNERLIFAASGWESLARSAHSTLEKYHKENPLRQGMPKEELKGKLKVIERYFSQAVNRLASDGVLSESGTLVQLPAHDVKLTPEQQKKIDAYLKALSSEPYSPPPEATIEPDLLGVIVGQGKAVKVADNVVFATDAYDEMVRAIADHIKANGQVTVAEVRDKFNTSRKYALALMEHLDSQKITRRVGDGRVLR
ncbi:MAG: selenocysteine-specific translation elongation factor [Chloroflexota bacterium]|nr:selenocysteine-specific translation elongation factor [Chloroflexota bacterium]